VNVREQQILRKKRSVIMVNKNRLVVCIMGQNCEKFLPMCLKSVQGADNIIFCDGGSTDNTLKIVENFNFHYDIDGTPRGPPIPTLTIIENKYDQSDKGMNGKQRNFYLDYLKKHHMGEWALAIDADEVVDNIETIKNLINSNDPNIKDIISINMRHFIDNLGTEDATVREHYVLHRLFKVKETLYYPEVEHPVLWDSEKTEVAHFRGAVIWHLAYCPGIFDIRKRYLNHLKKSEMHTKEYLDDWYLMHLFGSYPKSRIGALNIPEIILNEFLVEKDMLYFKTHSTLEAKHFQMSRQWIDHFKPETVLDLGAGIGLFGVAIDSYGIDYNGVEKSQWAVDNTPYKHLIIKQGDITEPQNNHGRDLVLVLDVLEHIAEEDIDKTLSFIKDYGKNYLFSIPYLGDPNLDLDPTHITKKPKEWWLEMLSKYFKISEVPEHFMYAKQMLMGCKK